MNNHERYNFLKRVNKGLRSHHMSREAWLDWFRGLCVEAQSVPAEWRQRLESTYFTRASDSRALILAAEHVLHKSGHTLGPTDDIPLSDWSFGEICFVCDGLSEEIQSGAYVPGPTRRVRIPKFPKGSRTIHLADAWDRVAAKGAQLILDAIVDPTFASCSYGFRRGRSRFHALARLEQYLDQGYDTAVVMDIKDAFGSVPHAPLLELLQSAVGDNGFLDHIRNLLDLQDRKDAIGIAQGNALSPVLLNLYCDRRIDRPWERKHPQWPLIRYADDMLILARGLKDGYAAMNTFSRLVTSAQLKIKDTSDDCVRHLCFGEALDWLGHNVLLVGDEMKVHLRPDETARLTNKLLESRSRRYSEDQLVRQLMSWIRSRGAACQHPDQPGIFQVIQRAALNADIRLDLSEDDVLNCWLQGHQTWLSHRDEERNTALTTHDMATCPSSTLNHTEIES